MGAVEPSCGTMAAAFGNYRFEFLQGATLATRCFSETLLQPSADGFLILQQPIFFGFNQAEGVGEKFGRLVEGSSQAVSGCAARSGVEGDRHSGGIRPQHSISGRPASNTQESRVMKLILPALFFACSLPLFAQSSAPPQQPAAAKASPAPQPPGAGSDMGHGAGDIGKGAGEGVGKTAEGVGKGAGDLVTLHPAGAAENVGKGVGVGAKDVGVGAAKSTGKVAEGTGKLIAKPFHHGKKKQEEPAYTNPPL